MVTNVAEFFGRAGVSNDGFIGGWTRESVLAEVARRRAANLPPLSPTEYLSPEFIANHLRQFDDGASFLVPRDILDRYGRNLLGYPDNTQFVVPRSQMDNLLQRTNRNIAEIEIELGITAGSWQNRELVRIDIPDPRSLNLRMSSGNEMGADRLLWIPGGRLPTGYSEAVIDNIPLGRYIERTIMP